MPPVIKAPCHNYTPVPNILPSLSLQYCAVCIVQTRIDRVKATQIALAQRGGVFESSTKGPQWSTIDGPTRKQVSHKDLLNKWRAAKINCCKLVEALEKMRDKKPEMVDEWGIDEALYLWELAKDECCRVPGYKYLEESSAKKEIEKKTEAKDLPQVEAPVSKHTPGEEPSEEDLATVKQNWQRRSSLSDPQLQREPKTLNAKEIAEIDTTAAMNGIKNLDISTEDQSKALAKHSKDSASVATDAVEDAKTTPHCYSPNSKESPKLAASPAVAESTQGASPDTPRSALKRRTSASPTPRKSVSIEPEATILPTEDTPLTTSPHNEHTIAEKRHARPTYHRSSGLYKASTWASPDGYEKINTSHFKMDWTVRERMQRLQEGKITSERISDEQLEAVVKKEMRTAERNKREETKRQPHPFRKKRSETKIVSEFLRVQSDGDDDEEFRYARLDVLENELLRVSGMRGVLQRLRPAQAAMREEKKWVIAESER
ncbi:hypothetical protein DDE82_006791 [Stemphylium lycopersici]|nr:hypothetical protein DDE82_006791 [Stemphylium lycopersici]